MGVFSIDLFIEYSMVVVHVTLEITHLGSGSSGNSAAYRSEDSIVVIDCGFSMRQMEKRLILAGIEPSDVDHILVTHHHVDHSKSAMLSLIHI